MVTKKHFEAIAAILREADIDRSAKEALTSAFCSVGRSMNPRFNRTRFFDAVFCRDFQGYAGCRSRRYSQFIPEEHRVQTEKEIARKVQRVLTGRGSWET